MTSKQATPPRFGTTPIAVVETDDMFALREQTCSTCGATFRTSQPATMCALCSSMLRGVVGPATVVCIICGIEHQVPILAPSKLCDLCRLDLALAESNVRADLRVAELAHEAAMEALDLAIDAADIADLARCNKAVDARSADAPSWAARWAKSLAKGDGLSPLLVAYDARQAAAQALSAALVRTRQALSEIEAAR